MGGSSGGGGSSGPPQASTELASMLIAKGVVNEGGWLLPDVTAVHQCLGVKPFYEDAKSLLEWITLAMRDDITANDINNPYRRFAIYSPEAATEEIKRVNRLYESVVNGLGLSMAYVQTTIQTAITALGTITAPTSISYAPTISYTDIVAKTQFLPSTTVTTTLNNLVTSLNSVFDTYTIDISSVDDAICRAEAILNGFNPFEYWRTYLNTTLKHLDSYVFNNVTIAAEAKKFADIVQDTYLSETLSKYNAGMRDMGAVMSSSFVIGAAILEGMRNRDINKHTSELSHEAYKMKIDMLKFIVNSCMEATIRKIELHIEIAKLYIEAKKILAIIYAIKTDLADAIGKTSGYLTNLTDANKYLYQYEELKIEELKTKGQVAAISNEAQSRAATINLEKQKTIGMVANVYKEAETAKETLVNVYKDLLKSTAEVERIITVMRKEQFDADNARLVNQNNWAFDVIGRGMNAVASYTGGVTTHSSEPSTVQSVLGGAFAGASIGAQAGPVGIAIGAIAGGIGGWLSR